VIKIKYANEYILKILIIFLTILTLGFGALALTGCTADYIYWYGSKVSIHNSE